MECDDCDGTGESANPGQACFICDGTGEMCDACGESFAVCDGSCRDDDGDE